MLVGPSGCGKTTALRMVAGLEEVSAGTIYIDGRPVNDVEPRHRDVAMVFQSYALYPHLSVYENMAFSLKYRQGVPKAEVKKRVDEAARILELEPYLERKPRQLSGGQRQRVAMGRAIVRQPRAFLMDEPLSNLDAKLRVQMRAEIAQLQRSLAHHDHLRHPRPDRGDDAGQPRRGAPARRAAADRAAAGAVPAAGQPVRGRLHRVAADEPDRRQAGARRATARAGPQVVFGGHRLGIPAQVHGGSARRSTGISAGTSCSASGPSIWLTRRCCATPTRRR